MRTGTRFGHEPHRRYGDLGWLKKQTAEKLHEILTSCELLSVTRDRIISGLVSGYQVSKACNVDGGGQRAAATVQC